MTLEPQRHSSGIFIVNFEQISHLFLVFFLVSKCLLAGTTFRIANVTVKYINNYIIIINGN